MASGIHQITTQKLKRLYKAPSLTNQSKPQETIQRREAHTIQKPDRLNKHRQQKEANRSKILNKSTNCYKQPISNSVTNMIYYQSYQLYILESWPGCLVWSTVLCNSVLVHFIQARRTGLFFCLWEVWMWGCGDVGKWACSDGCMWV